MHVCMYVRSSYPDPEIKNMFRPFGPYFPLKIKVGGGGDATGMVFFCLRVDGTITEGFIGRGEGLINGSLR